MAANAARNPHRGAANAGFEFIDEDGGGVGVRLRERRRDDAFPN
jgi:hypothetical protein